MNKPFGGIPPRALTDLLVSSLQTDRRICTPLFFLVRSGQAFTRLGANLHNERRFLGYQAWIVTGVSSTDRTLTPSIYVVRDKHA